VLTVRGPLDELDLAIDQVWLFDPDAVEERVTNDGFELVASFASASIAQAAALSLAEQWRVWVDELDDDSYLDAWRDHAAVVRVGRIVIVPSWLDLDVSEAAAPLTADDVVVHLDPGRAFGSGAHPTTKGVLDVLCDLELAGRRVLDVGCGSGVLSLAAVALGASQVVAIDVDRAALDATRSNATRNGMTDQIIVSEDVLETIDDSFDLVVANVLGVVLVELAPALREVVTGGGVLVLAGMLAASTSSVEEAMAPLAVVERRVRDGWATLVLQHAPR
jgi:ribosomal protein L11 methyltransferase